MGYRIVRVTVNWQITTLTVLTRWFLGVVSLTSFEVVVIGYELREGKGLTIRPPVGKNGPKFAVSDTSHRSTGRC